MTANNLGIVNHLHDYGNGIIDNQYCHVYHEGVSKKGGTNVALLIVRTLGEMQLLRDNQVGGKLNIIFDCSGQNHCVEACDVAKRNILLKKSQLRIPHCWTHQERVQLPLQFSETRVSQEKYLHNGQVDCCFGCISKDNCRSDSCQ